MLERIEARVDLERIEARARRVDVGRALLLLITAWFWLLGFVLAKVWIGIRRVLAWLALAIAWCVEAARVGWEDAHARRGLGSA